MDTDNELEYLKKEKWSKIRLELDQNTICAKSNTKTALFLLKSLQIKVDSLLELPYKFDLQYDSNITLGSLISLMQRENVFTTIFIALSVNKIKHRNKIW